MSERSWDALFERSPADVAPGRIADKLTSIRVERDTNGAVERPEGDDVEQSAPADEGPHPNPARIVADADVLAADLLVGGTAREALDVVRGHSWIDLVASEPLLSEAETLIARLSDPELATDWRELIGPLATIVDHPEEDHPALAAALHGDARHVLSYEQELLTAAAGRAIRNRVETSVKTPDAFVDLFDPAALYPEVVGGDYPGPDRNPRR